MRRLLLALTTTVALTAVALVPSGAHAQKAQDTLRFALSEAIGTADYTQDPKPEAHMIMDSVFDTLIVYDPASKEFKGDLAESWSRPAPNVLEFKLRHDVKFHDGSPFTADDVVYTINFLSDPASKLRFTDLSFVDHAEKVDDYTVRIVTKGPVASALSRLAISGPIYPKAILSKYDNKADFGRKSPIGTGPYKVGPFDPSKGDITLIRNDNYVQAAPWRPAATIKTVKIVNIPDLQTQVAQLMTGGVDFIRAVPKDQAENLATNPDLVVEHSAGTNFSYISFDAANRTGAGILSKPEVRQALMMAIDRNALAKIRATGATPTDALCTPIIVGCVVDHKPPAFDPEGAKKLLASAGYPNGFDTSIVAFGSLGPMGEAIGGQLRAIGVRATTEQLTMAAYRDRQVNGKIQMLAGGFDGSGSIDASAATDFFFNNTPRDYWRDDTINKLAASAAVELDPAKRDELYRQLWDRVNDQHYILPLVVEPSLTVHDKAVSVVPGTISSDAVEFYRIRWK